MANGDITSIKELGRYSFPGGGITTGGAAQNNKVTVWGEIVASYVSTGIDLTAKGGPTALGLTSIDFIEFEARTTGAASAIYPTDNNLNVVNMNATWKIFLVDQEGQANPAVPTAGDIITLKYFATGDSSTPELT